MKASRIREVGAATGVVKACLASVLALTVGGYAVAAEVGGSVVATTDYVYRGLTQTDHGAAAQGDVHLRGWGGWFGGIWGSTAFSQPELANKSELNIYLGHAWTLTPDWAVNVHYARYVYAGDGPYSRYYYDDYDEIQAAVSFQTRAKLSIALAPDIQRYSLSSARLDRGNQWSFEGAFRHPLRRGFSLTAGMGYYDLHDLFAATYWAWSGGLEFTHRQLQLNLTHFSTDDSAQRMFGSQTADGRWALTAAWRF